MNILYTCDNNYVWLMGISMISMFENNKNIDNINVYLLGSNISKENNDLLTKITQEYGRYINVIDVPKLDIPSSLVSSRWPLSAYTRLYAANLLPENVEKILYVDCDTIINGDISQLWEIDIDNNLVYGVKDCISEFYKKNIGLNKDNIYVNAGVLLMNLSLLRNININNLIDEFMLKYQRTVNYADQDVLNGIFKDKIGVLKPDYNVMTIDFVCTYNEIKLLRRPSNFYTEKELVGAINKPKIIHYTTNMKIVRPWYCNSNHPCCSEFRKYLFISPWSDVELQEMVFSTKESNIIGFIQKITGKFSYFLLGIIHAYLRPIYIDLFGKE